MLEFGGIEPNPAYETLMNAVKLVREQKVTFLLAVGGGSVLDGTKFIAAAANYPENIDPWHILQTGGKEIKRHPDGLCADAASNRFRIQRRRGDLP